MDSKIFESMGIDPALFLIAFSVLCLALLAAVILLSLRCRKLMQRYDIFMRGKDADTLEDVIASLMDKVNQLQTQDLANKDVIKVINKNLMNAFQKTGLVKYNAFDGMGGQTSFALAVLDLSNNGYLLNVIHSRNACYLFNIEITAGNCESALSTEEKTALDIAAKKKDRFYGK